MSCSTQILVPRRSSLVCWLGKEGESRSPASLGDDSHCSRLQKPWLPELGFICVLARTRSGPRPLLLPPSSARGLRRRRHWSGLTGGWS